jgi:hypothetical protein
MINLPGIRQGGYALHQWEIFILLTLIINYHCSLLAENISPFCSILVAVLTGDRNGRLLALYLSIFNAQFQQSTGVHLLQIRDSQD